MSDLPYNVKANFSHDIKREREKRDWSALYVAKMLGIHRNTYAFYEMGVTEPSFTNGMKLCVMLGLNPWDYLPKY